MPMVRDPLSIRYDTAVRRVLLAAIRAHQSRPKDPRAAITFISSPPRDFRDLDKGGLTRDERAFTRALYYQTFKVPRNLGIKPQWSAKITWGPPEKRGSRWGRPARVRLFRYGWGERYVRETMRRDPWAEDYEGLGDWRSGTRRSVPGDRIDSNRKRAG